MFFLSLLSHEFTTMKVIVADQFSPAGLEELKASGIDLVYDKDLNGESLKAAMEAE